MFGGAAMVLAFDARPATRDVDALFVPDGPMLDAAAEVASELSLPRSWLKNQASRYVSGRAGRGTPVNDRLNITTIDAAINVVDEFFPDEPLGARSRQLLEDLLSSGP